MLDLGTSFLASVARDPDAVAIVDADLRLTYAQWFARISSVVAAFDDLDLRPGDHIVTVLQNRWEAATIHWACQLAGIVITPINWRVKSDELDFCIENSESKALVYESVSAAAVAGARFAHNLRRVVVGEAVATDDHSVRFATMIDTPAQEAAPRVGPEAWSIMLYTSGTTSKPKGVPRRHRAERAAGIAHVAQNLYGRDERTLGVMPLYHTMGVRSLISMSLIGGTFVCLPRYDSRQALAIIEAEKNHQPLSGSDTLPRSGSSSGFRKDEYIQRTEARLCRCADDRWPAAEAEFEHSSRICSSIITAAPKSTPSRSIKTQRQSRVRRARPGSTNSSGSSSLPRVRRRTWRRRRRRARSSHCWPATSHSKAIGGAPTPMPGRCAKVGISPAIPASSTRTASCS